MIPLRRQLSDLGELVFTAEQDRGSDEWFGVSENLKVVAAIDDVGTSTPPGPLSLCSGLDEADESFNDVTRLHVGGMVVFTLTWQAFEAGVCALVPGSKAAGADGRKLLKGIGPARQVPLLADLLAEARKTFADCVPAGSTALQQEKIYALLQEGLIPAGAAECARQFRNGIVHGLIPFPVPRLTCDDDEPMAAEPEIAVFGQMTRLVAVLIQLLFSISFEEHGTIEHDGDEVAAWGLLDGFHMR